MLKTLNQELIDFEKLSPEDKLIEELKGTGKSSIIKNIETMEKLIENAIDSFKQQNIIIDFVQYT